MIIKINKEEISFTLQDEKTLGDIYVGLSEHIEKAGMFISDVRLNGENDLPLDDISTWSNSSLDSVDELDIWALSPLELRVKNFQTVKEYLYILREVVANKNAADMNNTLTEYPFIRKSLNSLLPDMFQEGVSSILDQAIGESGILQGELPFNSHIESINENINRLIAIIDDRVEEIIDPLGAARKASAHLETMLPSLTEVSVELQTGKDRSAMGKVIELTEHIQKVLRIIPLMKQHGVDIASIEVDGMSFQVFADLFNSTFNELIEAYANEDTVLIGDLLEYEISPRIEQLISFLHKDL